VSCDPYVGIQESIKEKDWRSIYIQKRGVSLVRESSVELSDMNSIHISVLRFSFYFPPRRARTRCKVEPPSIPSSLTVFSSGLSRKSRYVSNRGYKRIASIIGRKDERNGKGHLHLFSAEN
jgi:hypothetical protein